MKTVKNYFSLLGLLLFATVLPSSIKAYTHNGSKISNPNNAYYWIHGEFSKYGLKGEVLRASLLGILPQNSIY